MGQILLKYSHSRYQQVRQVLLVPLALQVQQGRMEVTVQLALPDLQAQRDPQVPPVPQVATVAMVVQAQAGLQAQPVLQVLPDQQVQRGHPVL